VLGDPRSSRLVFLVWSTERVVRLADRSPIGPGVKVDKSSPAANLASRLELLLHGRGARGRG